MSARERNYGVLWSYANITANIAIAVVFTPIFIGYLGQADYGLFVLAISFAAYLAILDMGISDASVRFLVKFRLRQNQSHQENFLANVLIVYVTIAVLILLVGGAVYVNLENWFGASLSADQLAILSKSFLMVLASVVITVVTNPISAVLVSHEKFIFLRASDLALKLASTVSIFVLLVLGYRVIGAVLVSSIFVVVHALVKWAYAFGILRITVRLHSLKRSYLVDILRYAAPILVVVLVEQIYWKIDNALIAIWIGTSAVAIYAVGLTFHKFFMSFSTAISRVMVPKLIGQIEALGGGARITQMLVRIGRQQAAVLGLLLLGLVVFGRQFLVLWLGPEFVGAYWVMVLTVCPLFLELISNLRNAVLQVNELYWWRAVPQLLFALLNVILTLVLIDEYGLVGAAASTSICILLSYLTVSFVCQIKAQIRFRSFVRGMCRGLLPLYVVCGVLGWVGSSLFSIVSWFELVSGIVLFSVLYVTLLYLIGLETSERTLVRRKTTRFLRCWNRQAAMNRLAD